MAVRSRITISIDVDILDWAKERATRRGISLAEQLRWTLRDGMWHRTDLESKHYRLRFDGDTDGR